MSTRDQIVNAPLVITENEQYVDKSINRYHAEQKIDPCAHSDVITKASILSCFDTDYAYIDNLLTDRLPVPS